MKRILLWLLLSLFLIVLPISAEQYQDAYLIFAPFFENGESPWEKTKDDAANFVNSLNGFSCDYVRTDRGTTNLICRSDRNKYKGFYKIVIDFGFTDEYIRALEIQISSPDLDDDISDGMHGFKAYLSVAEDRFRDLESIQDEKYYLDIKNPFNRIFSEDEIIPYLSFAFNENSVFCSGYREESDLAHPNAIVISLSQRDWFYRNQIVQTIDSETGEYRETIIAY